MFSKTSDAEKLDEIKVGGSTVKDFSYDAAGRTTSVVTGAGTTTLAYDYESRITTIIYPKASTNTFTYNGLDTRVGKVDSTGTKTYKRDGAYVTDPVLSDSAASYTPGISERRTSTTKFYHTDRLGTTERLTNNSQTTTDTRSYDAFGLLVSSSGSTPTPFGFAGAWGYQEDPDSGLKLLGHRYYDPSTGRFLTRDPIQDGRNWYSYCQNDPAARLDCDGAQSRRLTPQEKAQVDKAIEFLLENGQSKPALRLMTMRIFGKIRAEEGLDGAVSSWGKIYINPELITPKPGDWGKGRSSLVNKLNWFQATVWLASILLHEDDHFQNGEGGVIWGWWRKGGSEYRAWSVQIAFLDGLSGQFQGTWKKRIDLLKDEARQGRRDR
jgi:RHS repeat-associated protein